MAADGVANYEIARRVGVSANSVRTWRARFGTEGVKDFGDIAPGRGRKSWLPEGTVAAVVADTLHARPDDGSTHWTTRLMAARHGIGKDSVARIWRDHNLKPWKVETFKISNDPRFEEKLVDVVGLYLDPPERAVVFSFDEKTQVQALDRTQASLPMRPGRAGHDDARLQAQRDDGPVRGPQRGHRRGPHRLPQAPHRQPTCCGSSSSSTCTWPVTSRSTSCSTTCPPTRLPRSRSGWPIPKRARWHLHFTPTSSSWLNLVERWFKELTDRRLRRGTFTSVPDLVDAIETWVEHWNDGSPDHDVDQDASFQTTRSCGSLMSMGPAASMTRARAASAEWNP